jgi:hypothetical protein
MEAAESTNFRELDVWDRQAEEFIEDLEMVSLSVYETDSMVATVYINKIYEKVPRLARKAAKKGDLPGRPRDCTNGNSGVAAADSVERKSVEVVRQVGLAIESEDVRTPVQEMGHHTDHRSDGITILKESQKILFEESGLRSSGDQRIRASMEGRDSICVSPHVITSLIQRMVTKLRREKVLTIIIVPKMTTLPWYQSLMAACRHRYPIPTQEITYPVQSCERISSSWIAFCIRQW